MRISIKLTFFLVGAVTLFVGLAVALLTQVEVVASSYDAILQNPVREADLARVAQVTFKKQVQEWKDILLRGHNPEDLNKYTRQFHEQEAKVREKVVALSHEIQDSQTAGLLADFLAAHGVLSTKYQAAYAAYVKGGSDFKAADALVRGQDRAPTDLFDNVVARLDGRVHEAVAAQRVAVAHNRNLALGIVGFLFILLIAMGFAVVRSVISRLARLKAVSDRLARADIDGLNIDIAGRDEVGEFGESLKGVRAAIEELSTLAAAQTAASS
jgi:methyl-accepting chemotaxis protein